MEPHHKSRDHASAWVRLSIESWLWFVGAWVAFCTFDLSLRALSGHTNLAEPLTTLVAFGAPLFILQGSIRASDHLFAKPAKVLSVMTQSLAAFILSIYALFRYAIEVNGGM